MMHVVFVELKLLEVQPVPENLSTLDLSWYEDDEYLTVVFTVWKRRLCGCRLGADCSLFCFLRNKLGCVPLWVCESSRLEVLDINHNSITELPIQ